MCRVGHNHVRRLASEPLSLNGQSLLVVPGEQSLVVINKPIIAVSSYVRRVKVDKIACSDVLQGLFEIARLEPHSFLLERLRTCS